MRFMMQVRANAKSEAGIFPSPELVAAMGGTLDVQSDMTRGTRMTIALGLGEMPQAARGSAA